MPFFLYIYIRGLRKGPRKFFMGVLESPGKILYFLSVKEWEPCLFLGVARVLASQGREAWQPYREAGQGYWRHRAERLGNLTARSPGAFSGRVRDGSAPDELG